MSEPKPFASLSSGLLARKGTAKPAMRPQGFGQFGASLEDLGWNDMGHAPQAAQAAHPAFEEPEIERSPSPISALTPMLPGNEADEEEFEPAPPVVEQQRAAIAASFAQPETDEEEEHFVLATKPSKALVDEPEEDLAEQFEEIEAEAAEAEIIEAEAPAAPAPVVELPSRQPKVEQSARAKAAFTLRLEAERHLKLRLACAVTGRSAQQLVTEALDQLLRSKPEIEALAEQVPAKAEKLR